MSVRIPFKVRTLKQIKTFNGPPLTREHYDATKSLFKVVADPLVHRISLIVQKQASCIRVVIEFPQTYRVKNIIFRNAGSAFLHVLAGTTADYEAIAASDGATVPELASLVPDTQLCMQSQYADAKMQQTHASPLFKIRTFPSAKLSRYVVNRAYKFLLLEVRPFWDGYDKSVGISWIDVFGESAQEDDAAFHAALARSPSAQGENSQPVDLSAWAKDADGDASMETPKGLAAFKPTGEAARLLAAEQRNAPPKPPRNLAAEQARPILSRNETALKDLRGGAETGAAAASARPPPSCSQHPTAMMVQRIDRKSDPPRPFYVCLHKSATGQPCDTKIYA